MTDYNLFSFIRVYQPYNPVLLFVDQKVNKKSPQKYAIHPLYLRHTKSNKRFQTTTENASTFIDFLMPHPFTPSPASASSRTRRISVGPTLSCALSLSHAGLIVGVKRARPKNNRRCAMEGFGGLSSGGVERTKTKGIIIFMFFLVSFFFTKKE